MAARRARGTISRNAVLEAALAVAHRKGLRGVTIRAVAAEVGAPPMSLYTHFERKEQLIDQMFGHVLDRIFAAAGRPSWREELAASAHEARTLLLAHPHWLPLFTRVIAPTSALRPFEGLLRSMRKDGFSTEAAMEAVSAAMAFTLGLVLLERMMAGREGFVVPKAQLELLKKLIPELPPGRYPFIEAAVSRSAHWTFDAVFDSGLRSLISGIAADRRRSKRAR